MTRAQRMINRLPSLYRPQSDDPSDLIGAILHAGGDRLDQMHGRSAEIMQAHWLRDADRARLHPFHILSRQIQGLPALRPKQRLDVLDRQALANALQTGTALSDHLRESLTTQAKETLDDPGKLGEANTDFYQDLLIQLENRLTGEPLYTVDRFSGINLPQSLLDRALLPGLEGALLTEINQNLLVAAFPDGLQTAVDDHIYINDLARVAAILPLKPWSSPAPAETVEMFRLRVNRMLAIYRNGLGTEDAIRAMTAASLPVDLATLPAQRDLPFTIEINPHLPAPPEFIQIRGKDALPTGRIGPLMRWELENIGSKPIPPTVLIEPLSIDQGPVEAAVNPMIERFGSGLPVGLAFLGTIEPGTALRLQTDSTSWLARDIGVRTFRATPAQPGVAIPPNVSGWTAATGMENVAVVQFHQTPDHALWAAVNEGGNGRVMRFDGTTWQTALSNLQPILCLADDGNNLLMGTEGGLFEADLFPVGDFTSQAAGAVDAIPVHAILCEQDVCWLGTDEGLMRMESGGQATVFGPTADHGLAVFAIARDQSGFLYVGSDRALFQYQPWQDAWSWLAASGAGEQVDEWQVFDGDLPPASEVFLPTVRAIHRDRFANLWLGTDQGLARFRARNVGGAAYETVLEAFPDLIKTPVTRFREAPDGTLWCCTERGLLVFDGRDFWQPRQTAWAQLGDANLLYDPDPQPRSAWRFEPGGQWQRRGKAGWQNAMPAIRTSKRSPLLDVVWTDGISGNLGTWQDDKFQEGTEIDNSLFRLRVKPSPDRTINGGIPALPRLTPGTSTWRFLRLTETPQAPVPEEKGRPVWNAEGRLFPPPANAPNPWPGRFSLSDPPPESLFDQAVFGYLPAVQLHFTWERKQSLTVLVRLGGPDRVPVLDPAVIDRVWAGLNQVKPAGVRLILAAGMTILRGI